MTTPPRDPVRPAAAGATDYLLLALWSGAVAGACELAALGYGKVLLGKIVFNNLDALWMAPAGGMLLFLPLGLALMAASRFAPERVVWRLGLGALAFLVFSNLLFRFPQLHKGAAMLLALGLAVQGVRMLDRRAGAFRRMVRRSTPWLLAAVALTGVGLQGWRALRERGQLAALPAAPSGAPNVLLIILDTVRAMNMSLYGHHRPTTPRIDAWARGGVTFEHALSPASWTLPSHASLFTGRLVHELGTDWFRALDDTHPTLAERLRERGYETAGFVANVAYASREVGVGRGFIHYEDYMRTVRRTIESTPLGRALTRRRPVQRFLNQQLGLMGARKNGREVNRQFLGWLDGRREQRPFFVFLNYIDVHDNIVLPEFRWRFEPKGRPPLARPYPHRWTREEAAGLLDGYDEAMLSLDTHVGALLDSLARRGLLENTLIVLSSDHGHEFAEHGLVSHGNTLYRPSVEIPLVFSLPGRLPAGGRVATPVSSSDVPATILELVGAPASLPGRPLTRFWRGEDPGIRASGDTLIQSVQRVWNLPEFYPAMQGSMHSILLGGYRYIRNLGTGQEELFDFTTDTLEERDLAATPEGRSLLPPMRAALARLAGEADPAGGERPPGAD